MSKRRLYNNGVINKVFIEGEQPEGWVLGYCEKSKNSKSNKYKKSCLEKYGVENVSQSEEIKNKKIETCLQNFGVQHPMQSKEVQDKSKQTCLEVYGTEYASQSEEQIKKTANTCIQKYGVKAPSMSNEILEKTKQYFINKYGVENPAQYQEFKDKAKQTNLERYGTVHPMQSEEIKQKAVQTNLEKYGSEYYLTSDEGKNKIKNIMKELYGVEHPLQSSVIQEAMKQNNISKYGVENVFQSEAIKEKIKQTNLERYGVEFSAQAEEVKNKIRETNLSRFGVEYATQSDEIKEKIKDTCIERYGVNWHCQTKECRSYTNDSKPNKKFAEMLDKYNISYEREFHIGSYSYDFKINNILIEINPFSTHNVQWTPFNKEKGIPCDYHLNKTMVAEKNNYHCIHVFDWDSYNEIINKFLLSGRVEDVNKHFNKISETAVELLEDKIEHHNTLEEIITRFKNENHVYKVLVNSDYNKFPRLKYEEMGFRFLSHKEKFYWYSPRAKVLCNEESEHTVLIYGSGINTMVL